MMARKRKACGLESGTGLWKLCFGGITQQCASDFAGLNHSLVKEIELLESAVDLEHNASDI